MTTANPTVRGTRPWAVIEAVYDIWENQGRVDDYPTLDEALRVVNRLTEMSTGPSRSDKGALRSIYRWTREQHTYQECGLLVQEYLTNRKTWSPYIDQVAVDRALNSLAWDDYLALTPRERDATDRALSHRVDPFDWADSWHGQGLNFPRGERIAKESTVRGHNFRTTWPEEERRNLRDRIGRRRQYRSKHK